MARSKQRTSAPTRRAPPEVNPIDVIEAAYDLDADDREWLRNLATTVRPFIDGGRGMLAYTYDLSRPLEELHREAQFFDMNSNDLPDTSAWVGDNPALVREVHASTGLLGMLELTKRAGIKDLRASMPKLLSSFERLGIADMVALQSIEPGGVGVVMSAGQAQPRAFDARTRRLWSRVVVHIGAGRRLRAAIKNHAAAEEAILTPSGKLEHAEGEGKDASVRTALRDAVARVERARGKQRRSEPEQATDAWTALVAGRWSLVDRFERDGRRYIVARRNEHSLPDPRALTQRERAIVHLVALGKPNKLIGYELGLAESTIGSHLSQAMRKLGVQTRVDLITLVMGLGQLR